MFDCTLFTLSTLLSFTLYLQDLGLAQNAATANRCPTPMGSLAHQLYRIMSNTDLAGKDFASVFQFLQEMENKSK